MGLMPPMPAPTTKGKKKMRAPAMKKKGMPMKSIAAGQGPALAGPKGGMPMPIPNPLQPGPGYKG